MWFRALLVWFVLLAIAFVNGALRELLIVPAIGDLWGRALSTLLLSAAVLALCWLTIGWIHPMSPRASLAIGALWVSLTLGFEFLVGHYVFGNSWTTLSADYDVSSGRIWVLVLIVTGTAPYLCAFLIPDP